MRGRLNWLQLGSAREWSCQDMIVWLAGKPWGSPIPFQGGGLKFVDFGLVSDASRVWVF